MRTSESILSISKAIILFQGECPSPPKSSTGYGYSYSDLDTIFKTITPTLLKHGLGVIQTPFNEGDQFGVLTRVIHNSGEWFEGTFSTRMLTNQDWGEQEMGTIITYFRRYGLSALLGICPETDSDASHSKRGTKAVNNKPAPQASTAIYKHDITPNNASQAQVNVTTPIAKPAVKDVRFSVDQKVDQNYGKAEDFKMPFGKNKGVKLKDIPFNELESAYAWVVEKKMTGEIERCLKEVLAKNK